MRKASAISDSYWSPRPWRPVSIVCASTRRTSPEPACPLLSLASTGSNAMSVTRSVDVSYVSRASGRNRLWPAAFSMSKSIPPEAFWSGDVATTVPVCQEVASRARTPTRHPGGATASGSEMWCPTTKRPGAGLCGRRCCDGGTQTVLPRPCNYAIPGGAEVAMATPRPRCRVSASRPMPGDTPAYHVTRRHCSPSLDVSTLSMMPRRPHLQVKQPAVADSAPSRTGRVSRCPEARPSPVFPTGRVEPNTQVFQHPLDRP